MIGARPTTLFRGRVRRIHFVGIGGIGMSGIAEVLLALGFEVHGSDLKASDTTRRLAAQGAQVCYGHREENVDAADVVVMSSAVRRDNPEIARAVREGIPVIPRAEMLAELMRLKHGVAVAGSHGKTTTTSLVAAILNEGGLDPTVIIGGKVNQLGSNARVGQGELLVAEADESDGSFLRLTPTIAIVTNLDLEHVEHYTGGLPQLKAAFADFVNRVPFYGLAVLCIDEENVQALLPELARRYVTYGRSRQADYQAVDVVLEGVRSRFTVRRRGTDLGVVQLALAGVHNVLNALAAIAVAEELAIPFATTTTALASFQGVQRRFTHRGEQGGVLVIDDYGHHPAELRATLAAARQAYPGRRVVVLFQPHRYTRTAALKDDFARAFNDADVVLIAPVYAAGEEPIEGASAAALAEAMVRHGHHGARAVASLDDGIAQLAGLVLPGDVVLTQGAGDVTHAGPELLRRLAPAEAP
ncbi:MAG: UDP-N-acetylmuramate--L-alanine ligase [Deltaproteobacteria bacterium RBG_16_71_12]|nr:MAG: UDP-N-acetylmuramate--L-alanine ligase [Deltaproteobacteria bacterium RBG_16_71_12]